MNKQIQELHTIFVQLRDFTRKHKLPLQQFITLSDTITVWTDFKYTTFSVDFGQFPDRVDMHELASGYTKVTTNLGMTSEILDRILTDVKEELPAVLLKGKNSRIEALEEELKKLKKEL